MNAKILLKRAYLFIVLGLITVASYLQARGIIELLSVVLGVGSSAAKLGNVARRSTPSAPPADEQARPSSAVDFASKRDSSAPLSAKSARSDRDPLAWPACPGVELVIATESHDVAWSLASLRSSGASPAQLVCVGQRFARQQVAFVGWNPRLSPTPGFGTLRGSSYGLREKALPWS